MAWNGPDRVSPQDEKHSCNFRAKDHSAIETYDGKPKTPPPGLWSDPLKDHSAIKTYDGPTLKATYRTME